MESCIEWPEFSDCTVVGQMMGIQNKGNGQLSSAMVRCLPSYANAELDKQWLFIYFSLPVFVFNLSCFLCFFKEFLDVIPY